MERSEDWIREAEWDLKHAKNDLKEGFYNWACFSAQQADEKAVKAAFQKIKVDAWGHSVADLLNELSKHFNIDRELIDYAYELDKVYILAGYPNAHPTGSPSQRYTRSEAERLIKHAEEIIKFCKNTLSKI